MPKATGIIQDQPCGMGTREKDRQRSLLEEVRRRECELWTDQLWRALLTLQSCPSAVLRDWVNALGAEALDRIGTSRMACCS